MIFFIHQNCLYCSKRKPKSRVKFDLFHIHSNLWYSQNQSRNKCSSRIKKKKWELKRYWHRETKGRTDKSKSDTETLHTQSIQLYPSILQQYRNKINTFTKKRRRRRRTSFDLPAKKREGGTYMKRKAKKVARKRNLFVGSFYIIYIYTSGGAPVLCTAQHVLIKEIWKKFFIWSVFTKHLF